MPGRFKEKLLAPSARWPALALVGAGAVVGVLALIGFNYSLEATSTDEFCLGCHNHAIPYAQHQLTVHYSNEYGVAAGCADCHLEHAFIPKMRRKLEAAREVWGHYTGVIDTDEKYLAHQPEMKARELARFRSSDSATCRSCHDVTRMALEQQSAKAQRDHARLGQGKTCVDCHEDAGHAVREVAGGEGESDDFDF